MTVQSGVEGRPRQLPGMQFHHLGFATGDLARSSRLLAFLGYNVGSTVRDTVQNVDLCYCTAANGPDIELVAATETPGPVSRRLAEQGDHAYHLCYEVPGIEAAVVDLRSGGRVIEVASPQPAVLFDGRRVGFYHVVGLGLIELLEAATPGVGGACDD